MGSAVPLTCGLNFDEAAYFKIIHVFVSDYWLPNKSKKWVYVQSGKGEFAKTVKNCFTVIKKKFSCGQNGSFKRFTSCRTGKTGCQDWGMCFYLFDFVR